MSLLQSEIAKIPLPSCERNELTKMISVPRSKPTDVVGPRGGRTIGSLPWVLSSGVFTNSFVERLFLLFCKPCHFSRVNSRDNIGKSRKRMKCCRKHLMLQTCSLGLGWLQLHHGPFGFRPFRVYTIWFSPPSIYAEDEQFCFPGCSVFPIIMSDIRQKCLLIDRT